MKRITSFFILPAALCLGSGLAYAQHGHGMGGGGMSGMHGGPISHSEARETSGGGHATSSMMASKNPGDVLSHNTHLATKLEGLMGLSGTSGLQALKTDAVGFKNFGQFVAAVHVSHNLGIPITDLQAKMTGSHALSLGKAIQELKPSADSKNEAKKATTEATEDVKESAS